MHKTKKYLLTGACSQSGDIFLSCIWRMPFHELRQRRGEHCLFCSGSHRELAHNQLVFFCYLYGACHSTSCVSSEGRIAYFIIPSVFHGACHPQGRVSGEGGMAYFIIPYGIHGTCHFSGSFPIRFHSFLICNFLIQHLPHIEITYYLHSKGYDPGRRI